MTNPFSTPVARRAAIGGIAALSAARSVVAAEPASASVIAEDHWAQKGPVKLYIYRKYAKAGGSKKPVLFLVHGSSLSGRGNFDLQVPGHPEFSMMDALVARGFDVWTMDHENYGRSTRNTGTNSDIMSGVADLEAAMPVIEGATGQSKIHFFGVSSGALRAGVFAQRNPQRVDRLILNAFTWHGRQAPEIMRRRAEIDTYTSQLTRKTTAKSIANVLSRDDPATFIPAVADALIAYELKWGDDVPNGTYVDMARNLPMVDPAKLQCPVLMIRGQVDGNATDEELLEFFGKLPNPDKQFVKLAGITHGGALSAERRKLWHTMHGFLTIPSAKA